MIMQCMMKRCGKLPILMLWAVVIITIYAGLARAENMTLNEGQV